MSKRVSPRIKSSSKPPLRYGDDGELEPGCIGVSLAQRQWMGITEGKQVSVEMLPHLESPLSIQEMVLEFDFLKRGYQNPQPFLEDHMITTFTNAYKEIVMTQHEPILFKYLAQRLRGKIVSLVVGPPDSPPFTTTGIVTETTQITFASA